MNREYIDRKSSLEKARRFVVKVGTSSRARGISTGKIHVRGPTGLEGLTTYKYYLRGGGHIVADYSGEGGRPFTHRSIDREWKRKP